MKLICKIFLVAFIIISAPLLGPAGHGFAATAPKPAGDMPTKITSDKMQYDANKQQIVFTGKVKVTRPDFELTALTLTIFFTPSSTSSKDSGNALGFDAGAIERMVAEKNVHMTMEGGRQGQCEKATYTLSDETVVMEGNPVLSEGKNIIRGTKIIFYVAENRSEVQGTVQVDFTTKEKSGSDGVGSSVK